MKVVRGSDGRWTIEVVDYTPFCGRCGCETQDAERLCCDECREAIQAEQEWAEYYAATCEERT